MIFHKLFDKPFAVSIDGVEGKLDDLSRLEKSNHYVDINLIGHQSIRCIFEFNF